jgi:hypothetical protein
MNADVAASKQRAEPVAEFRASWKVEHGVLTVEEMAKPPVMGVDLASPGPGEVRPS